MPFYYVTLASRDRNGFVAFSSAGTKKNPVQFAMDVEAVLKSPVSIVYSTEISEYYYDALKKQRKVIN